MHVLKIVTVTEMTSEGGLATPVWAFEKGDHSSASDELAERL